MSNRLGYKGRAALFVVWCVCGVLLMGCSETTVTPLIRAGDTLSKPDRLLVYDFAVTPAEFDLDRSLAPRASGTETSAPQTDDEIQVGKAVARAITDKLIQELRGRGINAYRPTDTLPPGEDTASIKGRFLHIDQAGRSVGGFRLSGGQVRTHIWMFQGTGLTLRLVAESETATPSTLKQGIGSAPNAGGSTPATIEADAARIAAQVAERIVDYCKRRGWID